MANKKPLRCECGGKARWDEALFPSADGPDGGWECETCHRLYDKITGEERLEPLQADGRIKSPQDAHDRVVGVLARAEEDTRLTAQCLPVLRLLVSTALEWECLYAVMGREWGALQLGITEDAWRHAINKLERCGYIAKRKPSEVTFRKTKVYLREYNGYRRPSVYEVLRARELARCVVCGEPMRAVRETKTLCSERCRSQQRRAVLATA